MVINWDRMLGCGLPVHVAGVGVLFWHKFMLAALFSLGKHGSGSMNSLSDGIPY